MSSSDEEAFVEGSTLEISDPDTQFVPQEDDDEILWEVIEITGERAKTYKVKWAGTDPKTKKPWAQSWVSKHDCTDDLVHAWKLKQAKNKKKGRQSTVSKASKRSSTSSTTTTKPKSRSSATTRSNGAISPAKSTRSTATKLQSRESRSSKSKNEEPKRKRAVSPDTSFETNDIPEPGPSKRPTKRRKLSVEAVQPESEPELPVQAPLVWQKKVGRAFLPSDDDGETEVGDVETDVQEKKKGKGKAKARTSDDSNDTLSLVQPMKFGRPKGVKRNQSALSVSSPSSLHKKKKPEPPEQPINNNKVGQSATTKTKVRASPAPVNPTYEARRKRKGKGKQDDDAQEEEVMSDKVDTVDEFADLDWKPRRPRVSEASWTRMDLYMDGQKSGDDLEQEVGSDIDDIPPKPQDVIEHDDGHLEHDGPSTNGHNDQQHLTRDEEDAPQASHLVEDPEERSMPSKPPKTISRQRSKGLASAPIKIKDSFYTGVVLETETQSSTNGSHSQHIRPSPDRRTASSIPSPPRNHGHSSGTLTSRMKPRTPGSSHNIIPKPRRKTPINPYNMPRLLDTGNNNRSRSSSGSLANHRAGSFDDAGPASADHASNLKPKQNPKPLGPIPVVSPSNFLPHLTAHHDEEDEREDPPMSSIEEFSSPEKGENRVRRLKVRTYGNKAGSPSLDATTAALRTRGQELADAVEQQKLKEKRDARGPTVVLTDLLKKSKEKMKAKGKKRDQGNWVNEGRPGFEHHKKEELMARQMEEAYVNYPDEDTEHEHEHANPVADDDPRILLRQEEEENTQDLQNDVDVGVEMDEDEAREIEMDPDATNDEQEHDSIEPPSSLVDPENSVEEAPVRARTRSSSPVLFYPKTAEGDDLDAEPEVPATASTHHETPDQQPRSQTHPPTQSQGRHLGAALTLLNEKSEEILKLEAALANERETRELATKKLQSELAVVNEKSGSVTVALQKQLAEMREQLAARDEEITQLSASVDSLTRSKKSADDDLNFMREQYMQASGYVSTVRAENDELEKRAKLASSQATQGVAMIRQTFEGRCKALETEIIKWKDSCKLLLDKDLRTGDDIRRRAAEEPELRARCADLEEEFEIASQDYEARRKELEAQVMRWKAKALSLSAELEATKAQLLANSSAEQRSSQTLVYRCIWGRDNACNDEFASAKELEEHLLYVGHNLAS